MEVQKSQKAQIPESISNKILIHELLRKMYLINCKEKKK